MIWVWLKIGFPKIQCLISMFPLKIGIAGVYPIVRHATFFSFLIFIDSLYFSILSWWYEINIFGNYHPAVSWTAQADLDARMEMNTLYGSLAQGRFPELVQLVHVCVCVCLRCLVIGRKMGINPYRLIEVRTSRAASNTNGDGHCIPLTIAALVHRILLSNITMGLFFVCLVKMQVVSWKLSTRCSKSLIAAPGQLWCAPSLRKWVPGMPLGGVRLTSGVGDG